MSAPSRPPKAVIFGITATGIMVNTLINASLPEIARGLGAGTSAAGLLLGAATFPGILLAPVLGAMADGLGRRRVLVPCLALFGLAGVLGAVAPNLPVMLVARLLQGVGTAGLINLAIVLIGDHYAEERSRVIGQNSAVLTTCVALYPPLGGFLTDAFSFRAPFVLYALAGVTAVAVARTVKDDREGSFSVGDVRARFAEAMPVLRRRPVPGLFGAGTLVFALLFGLLLTVLPIYLDSAFGLSASQRGLALSGVALCNGATALNLGRISQVLSQQRRVMLGVGMFGVGVGVIAAAPTLWLMVPAIPLIGVGDGLTIPTLQDAAASVGDDDTRGTVVAAFVSFTRTGQTIGPIAATSALAVVGAPVVLGVGGAIAVLAVPLLRLALATPDREAAPTG